jgi:hypothetical protein
MNECERAQFSVTVDCSPFQVFTCGPFQAFPHVNTTTKMISIRRITGEVQGMYFFNLKSRIAFFHLELSTVFDFHHHR